MVDGTQSVAEGVPRSAVFRVVGMHCDSCVALIEETLLEEPAVISVDVNREPDEVRVTFDPERLDVRELVAVIDTLGYSAIPSD